MLDCFNEGFSDEEEQLIVCQMVPKVEVNFTKAHLQAIEPVQLSPSSMLKTARHASPELLTRDSEQEIIFSEEEDEGHFSADRTQDCAFVESVEQSCGMAELVDPAEYINDANLASTQPPTATSMFSQFKQVFVSSPKGKDAAQNQSSNDYEDPCKYERLQKMKKAKKNSSFAAESSRLDRFKNENSYA